MKDKKLYLYQEITKERLENKDDQIDIFSLASHNKIKILIEEDDTYFMGKEDLYFVIYNNKKSCIVLRDCLSYETKLEWISYVLLELLVTKKFGPQEGVQILNNGTMMKSYQLYELSKSDTYFDVLCELLIPSSKLSILFYQGLNHKKISQLSNLFSVREAIVTYKIEQFYSKTKYLVDGIHLKKYHWKNINV